MSLIFLFSFYTNLFIFFFPQALNARKMNCPAKAAQVNFGDVELIQTMLDILRTEEELVGLLPKNLPAGPDSRFMGSSTTGSSTTDSQRSGHAPPPSQLSVWLSFLFYNEIIYKFFILYQESLQKSSPVATGIELSSSNQGLFHPFGGYESQLPIPTEPAVPSSFSANLLSDGFAISAVGMSSTAPGGQRLTNAPPASQVINYQSFSLMK